MKNEIVIRRAKATDLDALERMEKRGFSSDRLSRGQFDYLITRANATVLLAEVEDKPAGDAIMLWRKGSSVGRLYSIVVDPDFQGRGVGRALVEACEEEALDHKCRYVSLEVRADNKRAIRIYEKRGYELKSCIPGYYEDGAMALRLVKNLQDETDTGVRLDLPYYPQTTGFTCGPACLMMAMKYLHPQLELNRSLELKIWKEATLIFMTSGLGGCGPTGLAVSAAKRGYKARVILTERRTPFLSPVRSEDKREVIRLVHQQLKEEADDLGVETEYQGFSLRDITLALERGEVPIVLISAYRLHRVESPHWVVVTGFDSENVYFHDPYEGLYLGNKTQAQHVAISKEEFKRMQRYGSNVQRCVIFIGSRSPGAV